MDNDVLQLSFESLSNPVVLECDMAGQFPLYVYYDEKQRKLAYSKSIKNLLDSSFVIKPLPLSRRGMAFLLQSGVIPPPYTIYENIYILGIGDSLEIKNKNSKPGLEFSNEFPFARSINTVESNFDEQTALELLAEATIKQIDNSRPVYLSHSAGKDSNMIALALAQAGMQDKVTSFSYAATEAKNESLIVADIAKKLGFRHVSLAVPDSLSPRHISAIQQHFKNSPLPCTDVSALLYPILATKLGDSINLIDGMGNDVYLGHVPGADEFKRQNFSKYLNFLGPAQWLMPSESKFSSALKTRAEWCGMLGFNARDSRLITDQSISCREYWKKISNEYTKYDYLEFRARIRGVVIDTEVFIRKVRNAGDVNGWNIIFPWMDSKVASYFFACPENMLFDRKLLKNKLILRKILKDRVGLDSDGLGKMPFAFDFRKLLSAMAYEVDDEIRRCKYWGKDAYKVINRLNLHTSMREKKVRDILIYRMYVVSAWLNNNKYINNTLRV